MFVPVQIVQRKCKGSSRIPDSETGVLHKLYASAGVYLMRSSSAEVVMIFCISAASDKCEWDSFKFVSSVPYLENNTFLEY